MGLLSTAARTVADWVKLGYPESVAKRIVSGDLPMDEASRLKRAEEQGYGDVLYHGSTHDIREFDGLLTNKENDMGQGVYLSDSLFDVNNNYAGEGPDLTNRIERTKEQIEDEIRDSIRYSEDLNETLLDIQDEYGLDEHDMAKVRGWADESGLISYRGGKFMPDHPSFKLNDESENLLASALTSTIARKQVKGANDGVVYPVRVKNDGIVSSRDRIETRDYQAEAADELGYDLSDLTDEQMDEVSEMAYELEADDWQSVEHSARSVASGYGADDVYIEPDSTWNEVRDSLSRSEMYDDDGMPVGSGQALAEVLQGEGVKGYRDLESPGRFAGMAAGKHTIMFPGSENQIRSVNAAFDPEYTGRNILGGATPGMMGAVAGTAGGASGIAALRNDVLNQLAAAKTVKERGDIRAPNSETLHKVTMAARDLERRLEGHPAGWLFPGGMLEYLEQANREERPSAMTRAMAFLDVL